MKNTEDNLRKEIKEKIRRLQERNIQRVYVSNGDFRRLDILIEERVKLAKAETNEQIELARASGYTEGCYVAKTETLKKVFKEIKILEKKYEGMGIKQLVELEQKLKDLEMTE